MVTPTPGALAAARELLASSSDSDSSVISDAKMDDDLQNLLRELPRVVENPPIGPTPLPPLHPFAFSLVFIIGVLSCVLYMVLPFYQTVR